MAFPEEQIFGGTYFVIPEILLPFFVLMLHKRAYSYHPRKMSLSLAHSHEIQIPYLGRKVNFDHYQLENANSPLTFSNIKYKTISTLSIVEIIKTQTVTLARLNYGKKIILLVFVCFIRVVIVKMSYKIL